MARSESDSITVSRRGSAPEGKDAGSTIIWVRGEHDMATKDSLVVAIAGAAQRDDVDVLVDLSDVTFMDASTVGALVGARNLLPRSRSLQLRAPSPPALRVLELCGLADLVQPAVVAAVHPNGAAAALSTWVDISSRQPSREIADDTVPSEQHQPAWRMPTADARLSQACATIEVDRGGP